MGHVFSFVVVEPVVLLVRVRLRVERHEQGRVRYVTDDAVDDVVVGKRLVPVRVTQNTMSVILIAYTRDDLNELTRSRARRRSSST